MCESSKDNYEFFFRKNRKILQRRRFFRTVVNFVQNWLPKLFSSNSFLKRSNLEIEEHSSFFNYSQNCL